jgi:holliday junction DNA helicase RuvB
VFSKLKQLAYQFKHKDIFPAISGHDDIKWLLEQALNSEQPVHILLVGKPGLGKTRFLEVIERAYADSYLALGSGATGAGMINACFDLRPRFLLVDEIEDIKQSEQAALLSLMQSGVLVETKISKTRRVEFKCSVIATCNSTKKLRNPLLSRFAIINIPEYDKEQFISVTKDRLGNIPLAEYIAEEVWNSKSPNIRDCVRIAAISKTEQDVLRYLRVLGTGLGESK